MLCASLTLCIVPSLLLSLGFLEQLWFDSTLHSSKMMSCWKIKSRGYGEKKSQEINFSVSARDFSTLACTRFLLVGVFVVVVVLFFLHLVATLRLEKAGTRVESS